MKDRIKPLAALTHPAWILGLTLLVVNDHILKQSEFAGAVTGKLSDFAGLLIAPVLLAAVLGVSRRAGLWACAAAVGVVFSAINLSPALAAAWDATVSLVVPFHTTVDPTDLMALVMIPLGLVLFNADMVAATARRTSRRTAQYALATIGSVMCMATSCEEPCQSDSDCDQGGVCVDELCDYPPKSCTSDSDCPEDYLECAEGLCSYRPMCDQSSDCPSGVCESDGRCDLAGVPVGGGSNMSLAPMMDPVEEQSLDLRTLDEIERSGRLEDIDHNVLDYLSDRSVPAEVVDAR